MPTAGEIENQINRSLQGLKDIKTDVKVNMKVGKLGRIKSQLRKALGNERFNVKAGVKVTGMAELNRLATQIEKVRRLAKDPINMKVDTGIKGVDDAVRQAASSGQLMARTRASQHKEMLQQERQFQKEMRSLQTKLNRTEQGILKNPGSAQADIYRKDLQRIRQEQEDLNREYRNWGARNGFSDNQIADRIIQARRKASEGQSSKLAKIDVSNQAKASAAAYRELASAIKEADKAQTRMISAGPRERVALQQQTRALQQQIRYQRESGKLSEEQIARSRKLEASLGLRRGVAEARQADEVRAKRRGVGGGAGIMATMNVWDMLQQGMYGAAAAVAQMNEVDKAITKVTKVVPDGQRAVNKWKKNIYRDASEVGKTAPEFASAVEQWATAGYNLKQSNRLAKASVMGSFVGEVPVNDMVKYMSVPMKAFQKEGLKSTDIINAMNQVSNKHAIEMEDLGQAYQKASSTVAATGTNFAQLTGIITAAQEGTRAGGDAIGTAYKTIGSRLAKIGTGLTKQDKTRAAFFKHLGVDLTDSNGKLKSTWQIMDQLGKKWKTMSSEDKNTAAQYAAGANHANIFQATLDNWKTARQAMREADDQKGLGSSGSAYQEMAKQRQSIEFQLAQLKNTWLQFLQNITGGREGISQMLGLLNGFGGVVNKLTANKGFSSLLRWGTIAVGAVTARRAIGALAGSLGNLISNKNQQGAQGLVDKLTGIGTATQKFKDASKGLRDSWNDFKGKGSSANTSAKSITEKTSVKPDESSSNNIKKETEALKENNTQKRKNADSTRDYANTVRELGGEFVPEGNQIEENTQKASRHGRVMTRLSKGWKVASSALGLVGAGLGYVGIAMDAVVLAGATMQALGIHPIKMLQKAMDPAGESAKSFGRYIDRVGESIRKTNNAIENNGIVTGQLKADMDSVSNMKKVADSFGSGSKLDSSTFKDLKKEYNSLAKRNGLELRISDNNSADNVKQKIKALDGSIKQIKKEDIDSLGAKVDKQIRNIDKSLGSKNWQKLLNGDKDYTSRLRKLTGQGSPRAYQRKTGKEYDRAKNKLDEEYRSGSKNAEIWNSSNGRKVANQVASAQKGIRSAISSMGDAYANGTIGKKDLMSMSDTSRSLVGLGVIKNLRDLQGANKNDDSVKKASSQLSEVLSSLGASSKQISKIQKAALAGDNASLLRGMKSSGLDRQLIMAMAGIGAQYQQQYHGKKGGAIGAAARDADDIQKYQKKHKGHSQNADALIDPNTGMPNFNALAKFNSGAVTTRMGREIMKAVGVNKYDGRLKNTMSTNQLMDLTTGLSGDPTKILNNIAKGKASVGTVATVVNNAHGVKRDKDDNVVSGGATGSQITRGVAQSYGANGKRVSKKQFDSGMQEAVTNGQMTAEQADQAIKVHDRNFTKSGNAKTVWGAMSQLPKNAKQTAQSFKDLTKSLSNKERKEALNKAVKNGNLTKKQADNLRKEGWTRQKEKGNRGKTERDTDKPESGKSKPKKKKSKSKKKDDDDDDKGNSKRSSKKSNKNNQKNQINKPGQTAGISGMQNSERRARQLEKAWNGFTKSPFAKGTANMFSKIGKGFSKGGILGGMFNLGKMGGTGLQKMLFGKKLNLGSMFKGRNNPFNGLKNAFRGKNNPFNGIRNMFKGKNNPFSGLKNMFSGKNNPLSKLFGGKGKKLKLQADTKGLSKSISKLGKGKGQKVKLQADTKALGKSLRSLGKGKGQKVKLQADTRALSKSISRLGKGKGQKVKLQADTRALSKSLTRLGKGKGQKIKLQADTRSLSRSLKGLKGLKKSQRIKITAGGNALSKVKQIKSALHGIKSSKHISLTASGNAKSVATKVKSAVSSIPSSKHINISASGNAASMAKRASSAINSIPSSHKTNITAHDGASGKARAAASAINAIPTKHNTHITVTGDGTAISKAHNVASAINNIPSSKSVTISVTKNETHVISEKHKGKSVVIDPQQATQLVNPLKSMSVVAQSPQLMRIVNASAANMGVDANSAMNGQKVTDYSDSTQDVSEDYWRYMGNQLYTGLPLDEQVNKLESAVTQADQDMDKLINLSRQRIDVDNKQIAYQKTMQNAYQQQITDMINQLHQYGFQNNGNQITNLIHAKDIHGDNASKVDDLLSKYQSAYQNFSEATQKIQELQTDIWQQGKNQEDYRNTKDQKMVENLQRSLELLTTAIDNHKNILERKANSLSDEDYVMRTENSAEQIQVKSADINDLLKKFNELSVANFVGTKDADNAKNLLESLQSIRDAITENLDSIADLKKTMRDIQLSSIIENLSKYTDNLNNSIDRLKNNVTNLQDGLLSGTTYSDLISSNFDAVNLDQRTAYEKSVNDRISLEEELDKALDKFAQKNVDRTAQVANQELQINQQKYEELLKMRQAVEAHTIMTLVPIKTQYQAPSSGNVYQDELEKTSHNKEYLAASVEYQREMNELKDRYNDKMKNASSQAEKEAINQAMVFEQLALQEKVYNRMIAADQQAINELKKQAENPDMSTEQRKTISDQITEYENNIMEAQNNIKDAIKGRFEYEKQLLDKQMDEYKRASDTISNLVTIADALHLDGETQARVINQQYASTYREYENYLDVLARLRKELSSYEKGSFEYNQLSDMINDYQSTLDSTVTSLLDITKEEFSHTLDSIQDSFEKSVNDGMTANQAKFDQDVWYNPMQKELKLEEMRLKITELEDKTVEKRIAALDAQERMSKAEADYVDKQLDLALAEQKLNNTINKKDVRYLEKDENGKFNWTYIADQDSVDAARQEVNQAKQAIEDAKVSNRNDYIEKVEEVISGAKDGTLNQEEVRKRLEQLNNSYKFILKEIPTFDISKVEDIISAYDAYAEKNKDIIDQYKRSANVSNNAGYQEIVKGFGEQFKAVSKDLGEIFGKQLREALNLPDGIRNAYGNGSADKPVVIQNMQLELPNVHDANEFAEALKTLPQVAQQYASHK